MHAIILELLTPRIIPPGYVLPPSLWWLLIIKVLRNAEQTLPRWFCKLPQQNQVCKVRFVSF